jgi:hypothetical protein
VAVLPLPCAFVLFQAHFCRFLLLRSWFSEFHVRGLGFVFDGVLRQ